MVFVPALGVGKYEMRGLLSGQKVQNDLFFYLGSNPSDADFTDWGINLATWYVENVIPSLTTNYQYVETYITDLSSATAPTFSLPVTPGAITGEDSGTQVPNNVALCVSFRTNGRGKSARGRNFISGWTSSKVIGNVFQSAAVNAMDTAYNALLELASTEGVEWVVLSTISGGAPRSSGLKQPVTGVVITDTNADSQRRRLPGRGR